MTPEVVRSLAWLGVAVGVILIIVITAAITASLLNRDDGYRWLGEPLPPPERRSPFAPDAKLTDTEVRVALASSVTVSGDGEGGAR